MIAILIMLAKVATLGLLKIKVFSNKGYDVIIFVHYITTTILKGFDQKKTFFEGCTWFKFNNLGVALGIALKFYTSVAKGWQLEVWKFWELTPTFVEVTAKKAHVNRVKKLEKSLKMNMAQLINYKLFWVCYKLASFLGTL